MRGAGLVELGQAWCGPRGLSQKHGAGLAGLSHAWCRPGRAQSKA